MIGDTQTGKTIREIKPGDSATFSKTISETDIYLYSGISGDTNPAHIDEEYARKTQFQGRIAHGMLTAGLISAVFGTRLPGPGTIYLSQTLKFKAPVRIGDTITARCEALEILDEKNRARFRTVCTNQQGVEVIEGEALVMPPK